MLLLPIKLPSSPSNPAQMLDSGDPPAAADPTGADILGAAVATAEPGWGQLAAIGRLPHYVCLLAPRGATKVMGGFPRGPQHKWPPNLITAGSSGPCASQLCTEPDLCPRAWIELSQIHPWQIQLLKRQEDEFEGFSSQRGRLGWQEEVRVPCHPLPRQGELFKWHLKKSRVWFLSSAIPICRASTLLQQHSAQPGGFGLTPAVKAT